MLNPSGPAVLTLGLVAFVVGVAELFWFYTFASRENTFPAFSTHQIWCIGSSAVLALANGVGAVLEFESMDFYLDICTVARCVWVYHYCLLLMAYFDPRGHGGRHELIMRTGAALERAKLGPQAIKPPFRCYFGCASTYRPSVATLFKLVRLIEFSIAGLIFMAIIRLTLVLEENYYEKGKKCPGRDGGVSTAHNIINVFITIAGVAGMVQLTGLLEQLILPNNRPIVVFRHRMYIFILPIQSAVQNAIVFGIIMPQVVGTCNAKFANQVVTAVEMLIFQVRC